MIVEPTENMTGRHLPQRPLPAPHALSDGLNIGETF
jgi:hypothetical protein